MTLKIPAIEAAAHARADARPTLSKRAHVVRLPASVSSLNTNISTAFRAGATAVLVLAEELEASEASIDVLCQALVAHPRSVLSARVVGMGESSRVCNGGLVWSEEELAWTRETYIELTPTESSPAFADRPWLPEQCLMIPALAWRDAGEFDARLPVPLAAVDWCVRARRAGFACLLLRDAAFAVPAASMTVSPSVNALASGTMVLARRHAIPCGAVALAYAQIARACRQELDLVDFWADYGHPIGVVRRVWWFAKNAVEALRRERARSSIGKTWRDLRAAHSTHQQEVA